MIGLIQPIIGRCKFGQSTIVHSPAEGINRSKQVASLATQPDTRSFSCDRDKKDLVTRQDRPAQIDAFTDTIARTTLIGFAFYEFCLFTSNGSSDLGLKLGDSAGERMLYVGAEGATRVLNALIIKEFISGQRDDMALGYPVAILDSTKADAYFNAAHRGS